MVCVGRACEAAGLASAGPLRIEEEEGKGLLGHRDARPNTPFVQEERLDEVVDVAGPLQLQRVPCVLDDL